MGAEHNNEKGLRERKIAYRKTGRNPTNVFDTQFKADSALNNKVVSLDIIFQETA